VDAAASLITAIAALVTAIGGASAAVIVAWRSSGRERMAAAEEAERLATGRRRGRHEADPEPEPDDNLTTTLREILDQLEGRRDEADEP
jgi:hypothetical protein